MYGIVKSLRPSKRFYNHSFTKFSNPIFSSQQFLQNISKVSSADDRTFAALVEEIYKANKTKLPSNEEQLQKILTERMKTISIEYIPSIIKSLTSTSKYSAIIPRSLLENIIDRYTSTEQKLTINTIYILCSLVPAMIKEKINYFPLLEKIISRFSTQEILKLPITDLAMLSDVLSKVGFQNKYFDPKIEKKSIYVILEQVITSLLPEVPYSTQFKFLKCFIINDRGNEDFIRKLEVHVFGRLIQMEDKELSDVPYFYYKRVLHHTEYLHQAIYKPLYEEAVRRFDSIHPLSKSLFILNYWKNSTNYGMYCDSLLGNKIKQLFHNNFQFKFSNTKQKNHMMTICLGYLAHARQFDKQVIDSYISILKNNKKNIDSHTLMRSAVYLSRYQETSQEFWEIISSSFNLEETSNDYIINLYAIWLNLHLKDKENFEVVKHKYSDRFLTRCREAWKSARKKDLRENNSNHYQLEVKNLLKKKNINFIEEFYLEYYIDFALPEYKIGIELTGPGHYLFPDIILNGKSQNRKKNLEALGWTMYHYPVFSLQQNKETIEEFLNNIIPFYE